MLSATHWSLPLTLTVFAIATVAIALAGVRLAGIVDALADRTRIGEAMAGAVMLGGSTSIAGSVVSVQAAWQDRPELALSNAIGGIAVQTLFLGAADLLHRRANLEHAAASAGNMLQGALLICLMAIILIGVWTPSWTLWHIHLAAPALLGLYALGLRLLKSVRETPMWFPRLTRHTTEDVPDERSQQHSLRYLWMVYLLLVGVMVAAGAAMETTAARLAEQLNISQSVVGFFLTAISTSLPELITTTAAVRRGALTLAVGGIIGGNAFDTLFTAASDVAYRRGPIFAEMTDALCLWTALSILMTGFLLMGLIRRQESGPAGIGFESVAIIALYGVGVMFQLTL